MGEALFWFVAAAVVFGLFGIAVWADETADQADADPVELLPGWEVDDDAG